MLVGVMEGMQYKPCDDKYIPIKVENLFTQTRENISLRGSSREH